MQMSGQLQTPAALRPIKKPGRRGKDKNLVQPVASDCTDYVISARQNHRYPLNMTTGGYQIQSGNCGGEKNMLPLAEI
jgi:hypothetical protein